ncbi:uncharacterized protein LOC127953415 [Carassius gibelio]|uniref:uncharacterized protein LOC127953415 n=1 Tax=Carassius gibelio TaxID=101364 RepID=UPI00227755B1|nr:uncharacterized protein LOC127953415 [Carassius gibelio]XP_052408621.1 uncharacterized protein LOC127953415 [Carassius gibelio]
MEQSWHKPRTMGIKPGPVNRMLVLSARPKERKLAEGLRSTLYKGVTSELPDLSFLQIAEAYKDFASAVAPLVTTMEMSNDDPLVDSAFGKVQYGSVLSYQQPAATTPNITHHQDAPPPPPLPLVGHSFDTSVCLFVHSEHGQLHMKSLAVSLDMAHKIEHATKEQSASLDWHSVRKPRVTASRFREVCHVRGQSSAEHLAERIYKGTRQTADMKRGLEMESAAIEEYCLLREVNYHPCGFLIHPDAHWLGASPDGIIFDPKEHHVFGLLEIKCPNVKSYVDCPYLKFNNGTPELKQQHAYYWQVQGQMLISGLDWCDFVIYAQDDMMVQRIYKDLKMFLNIREKADHFFFYFYLPRCLQM